MIVEDKIDATRQFRVGSPSYTRAFSSCYWFIGNMWKPPAYGGERRHLMDRSRWHSDTAAIGSESSESFVYSCRGQKILGKLYTYLLSAAKPRNSLHTAATCSKSSEVFIYKLLPAANHRISLHTAARGNIYTFEGGCVKRL